MQFTIERLKLGSQSQREQKPPGLSQMVSHFWGLLASLVSFLGYAYFLT